MVGVWAIKSGSKTKWATSRSSKFSVTKGIQAEVMATWGRCSMYMYQKRSVLIISKSLLIVIDFTYVDFVKCILYKAVFFKL